MAGTPNTPNAGANAPTVEELQALLKNKDAELARVKGDLTAREELLTKAAEVVATNMWQKILSDPDAAIQEIAAQAAQHKIPLKAWAPVGTKAAPAAPPEGDDDPPALKAVREKLAALEAAREAYDQRLQHMQQQMLDDRRNTVYSKAEQTVLADLKAKGFRFQDDEHQREVVEWAIRKMASGDPQWTRPAVVERTLKHFAQAPDPEAVKTHEQEIRKQALTEFQRDWMPASGLAMGGVPTMAAEDVTPESLEKEKAAADSEFDRLFLESQRQQHPSTVAAS